MEDFRSVQRAFRSACSYNTQDKLWTLLSSLRDPIAALAPSTISHGLFRAAREGHHELLSKLLWFGFPVLRRDFVVREVIMYAAEHEGEVWLLEEFLEFGWVIEVRDLGRYLRVAEGEKRSAKVVTGWLLEHAVNGEEKRAGKLAESGD